MINIGVHVSFSIIVSSGYMLIIGIVESYGNFIPSGKANWYSQYGEQNGDS